MAVLKAFDNGTGTWIEIFAIEPAGPPGPDVPAGTVVDYMGTVSPTGWVILAGQTIIGGQSLYPEWWAVLPASMKSGANILCPDTRGRVSVGFNASETEFDTIGETGGEKTHVLTAAETAMKGHGHTASSGTVSADHSHATPAHTHTGVYGAAGAWPGSHARGSSGASEIFTESGGGGQTGGISANHTHAITVNPTVDANGSAHNNLQPYVVFSKMARAY